MGDMRHDRVLLSRMTDDSRCEAVRLPLKGCSFGNDISCSGRRAFATRSSCEVLEE
jgi:hypothetical protein